MIKFNSLVIIIILKLNFDTSSRTVRTRWKWSAVILLKKNNNKQ